MPRPCHVLITGNRGYVGAVLVPWLREHLPSATLTGCDVGWFDGVPARPEDPAACLDRQLELDVRDLTAAHLEGVDAIVHLAAVSNDPIGNTFEAATDAINHLGTASLVRAAAAAGVRRFVLASSCSVYGASAGAVVDETGTVAPLSAYARSKVAGERALRELAGPRLQTTALRFGTACGFSPRLRLDLVLNDFVASALATGRITLLSTGTAWRPLVHVQDMARAIEWALGRGGERHECVHVGSEAATVTIRGLAERAAACVPGARVECAAGAAVDARSYRVAFDRFRALAPQHQPRWTVEQAVDELREGLLEMRFRDEDFRCGPFVRLQVLRELRATGALDEDLRAVEVACGAI